MGDFDDEEAEAAAVVASAGDDKKARKNQGNGRGGGGGKKTKQQKPNVQDEEGLNLSGAVCFAYSCPDEVKQNSRFCRKHENLKVQTKKTMKTIKKQAKNAGGANDKI